MCKMKKMITELSETATFTRMEYVLLAVTCFLGGIVIGMLCSPRKDVKIMSENGSYNSDNKTGAVENGRRKCMQKSNE